MNIERYVRLTLLDQKDTPKEQIEGKVTGGSINIDGASKFRRNCSLTLVAIGNEDMIHDELWALTHKFRLEIGDKQDNKDIVYYKQGVFVINSFSKSKSNNGFNVSISGQDKMCLLNGTMGGQLAADHDFGTIEEIDSNGVSTITKLPLHTIIYQAMQTYGHERPENIIINDLDIDAFEVWEYRGTEPMYYILNQEKDIITILFDEENVRKLDKWGAGSGTKIDLNTFKFYSYNTLDDDYNNNADLANYQGIPAYIAKIETGHTAGFHRVPLVYNSDLVLSAGEPFTSLLDKIVGMLGPYEYFFNVDGRFVFQKKKTYIQELFSPKTGDIMNPLMTVSPYSYEIDDDKLNTQVSWSPKIDNVKNDFVVWGKKSSGARFHGRCAIDRKPTYYKTMEYYKPFDTTFLIIEPIKKWSQESKIVPYIDVSESLNQDAQTTYKVVPLEDRKKWKDANWENLKWFSITTSSQWIDGITAGYYNNNQAVRRWHYITIQDGYQWKLLNNNFMLQNDGSYSEITNTINNHYEAGRYYSYIESMEYTSDNYDWRELIYQMAVDFYRHNQKDNFYLDLEENNKDDSLNLNRYPNGITGYEQYYTDMQAFWRLLYNPQGDWHQYYGNDPIITAGLDTDVLMADALKSVFDIKINKELNIGLHTLGGFVNWPRNPALTAYLQSPNLDTYQELKISLNEFLITQALQNSDNGLGFIYDELVSEEKKKNLPSQTISELFALLKLINNNQEMTQENFNNLKKYVINNEHITNMFNDIVNENDRNKQIAKFVTAMETILDYIGWIVNFSKNTYQQKIYTIPLYDQSDRYWNRAIHTDPESLLFWFEFLDGAGELDNYSVSQIGQKAKVENVESIQTIYYRERPEVQFIVSPEVYESTDTAYKPVWIPAAMQNLFVRSTEGISTIDKINDLIYQHSACSEGLSITCIPIWDLQPNTRVRVRDTDYTLDKISCSLAYNGTMSLTLTKILTNFY